MWRAIINMCLILYLPPGLGFSIRSIAPPSWNGAALCDGQIEHANRQTRNYYSTPHHHLWLIIVTITLSVEWSNNFLHLLRARWCTRCSFVLYGDQGYCWYSVQTVIEETLFSWSATVERAREIWPRELPGSFTVCMWYTSLTHPLSLPLIILRAPSHSHSFIHPLKDHSLSKLSLTQSLIRFNSLSLFTHITHSSTLSHSHSFTNSLHSLTHLFTLSLSHSLTTTTHPLTSLYWHTHTCLHTRLLANLPTYHTHTHTPTHLLMQPPTHSLVSTDTHTPVSPTTVFRIFNAEPRQR